jgi:hypothetical protein
MATCLDIITLAMKQCRVLPAGGTPSGSETDDGMTALQSLYDDWRTGGMFGHLCDEYLTEDTDAQEGKRYYVPSGITLTHATSEYVPDSGGATYGDYGMGCECGSTGDTRQPRDMALYEVLESDGTQTARLYDRTGWVDLLDLDATDIAPLSARGANGLAACLATSGGFADLFGAQPGPGTVAVARHFLRNVMGKVGSTQDSAGAEYF